MAGGCGSRNEKRKREDSQEPIAFHKDYDTACLQLTQFDDASGRVWQRIIRHLSLDPPKAHGPVSVAHSVHPAVGRTAIRWLLWLFMGNYDAHGSIVTVFCRVFVHVDGKVPNVQSRDAR